jgi:FkbH-like protein
MNSKVTIPDVTITKMPIAANFVADQIIESLHFWVDRLELNYCVQFAQYNQIIQQLLDPAGIFRANSDYALVLIQIERWGSVDSQDSSTEYISAVRDFIKALKAVLHTQKTTFIVIICPASPAFREQAALQEAEDQLLIHLRDLSQVDLVTPKDIEYLYPLSKYEKLFDTYSDKFAQIPYSLLGFATLGTMVARRIHCLRSKPRKVIVVDCDNTLWSGICGEDSPMNIQVTPSQKIFQEFLLKQREKGRLICLCSKNEEAMVFEVFTDHPDMVLRREHLTAWKVNWEAKAVNLWALSNELSLSLDSFVFIDDDTFECESMRTSCPEVGTFQLPKDDTDIVAFLRNIWDFDTKTTTIEDQNRSLYYHLHQEREKAQKDAGTLKNFLLNLKLNVQIMPLALEDIARAIQLTERTNQFNLNGIRYSASDLIALHHSAESKCLSVRARDRFGDYGMVGLLVYSRHDRILRVNALLLSCRALGKGVEYQLVHYLTQVALQDRVNQIEFAFTETAKNRPLQSFLSQLGVSQIGEIWTVDCETFQHTSRNPVWLSR